MGDDILQYCSDLDVLWIRAGRRRVVFCRPSNSILRRYGMFGKLSLSLFALAAVAVAGVAQGATTTTLTLLPGSGSNVAGSYNPAPGFPSGSWQANAPTAGSKSEVYIAAGSLFSQPVTISDIASVTYWTNIAGTGADPNWTFYIYTAKT